MQGKTLLIVLTALATAPALAAQNATPAHPAPAASPPSAAARGRSTGLRLEVSLAERRLWLKDGDVELFSAPVGVGKSVVVEFEEHRWDFSTPRGNRKVLRKERDPVWIPPDWHYVELAVMQGWQLVRLERGKGIPLEDGSRVVVRGNRAGRVLPDGSFEPVPSGEELVFGDTLFIPPTDTENRRIRGELGKYKLDMGGGYYIHGTPYENSVGQAETHGCLRMVESDLEYLYRTVRVGTPVLIY